MQLSSRLINHLKAGCFAAFGLILVYGGVVMMNELSQAPDKEPRSAIAEIEIQNVPKVEPKKLVKQKPRPKPRPSRLNPPPAPLAGLGTGLSGINFGIPELQISDVAGADDQLLGETDNLTMTGETVDVPPRPSQQRPIEYPRYAKKKGIKGYVLLSLLIKADGNVEQVQVLESKPEGIFEEAAVQGVRRWVFEPALYKGEAVRVWARQRVQFQLG